MMPRWSISLRLTLWFGSIFFIGWLLFGLAMWLNLQSTLTNERYQTLSRRIERLQDLLRKTQDESEEDRHQEFREFARATGNGLNEVFRMDGGRVFPSPSAAAKSFPWPALQTDNHESFSRVSAAGQSYRVLVRPFTLANQSLYLAAAAPEAGNILILSSFLVALLASAPVLLLVSSACGYWVGRRALKPVDQITSSAQSISIRNLSERLPVAETSDELQRLAETCNAMLSRLESAVTRIKQFTADASHELRAPLSFIRTVAEVELQNPQIDPGSRRAFAQIVDEGSKAAVLLGDMLTLARADSECSDMQWEPVDLAAVLDQVCEKARSLAEARNLSISITSPIGSNVNIKGDYLTLRRLVWIMLDNAIKYTPAPGRIDVILSTDQRQATLLVRDSGIGISKADLPFIFDRFYRVDPSRSQVEGSGLGLAIAKWITEMHHADLSVVSEEDQGTTFHIVFPLCGT